MSPLGYSRILSILPMNWKHHSTLVGMAVDLIYDFDVCLFKSVVTNKVEKTHKTVKSKEGHKKHLRMPKGSFC